MNFPLAKAKSDRSSIVECHTDHIYEVRSQESKEWSFNLKDYDGYTVS
jgi:hypothetical protein